VLIVIDGVRYAAERSDGARRRLSSSSHEPHSHVAVPRHVRRYVHLLLSADDHPHPLPLPADVRRSGHQEGRPDGGLAGLPVVDLSATGRHDGGQLSDDCHYCHGSAVGSAELRVVSDAGESSSAVHFSDAGASRGDAGGRGTAAASSYDRSDARQPLTVARLHRLGR